MHLFAFSVFAALPFGALICLTFAVLSIKSSTIAKVVAWLLMVLGPMLFGTSIAVPGFGTKLANGGTTGASYTNVAQCTDTKLSLGKAKKFDITNFDSPASSGGAVNQEFIKTMIEASSVGFGMVFSPADPTQEAVAANLQAGTSTALNYWRITSQDGTTFVFQGYIESEDIDFKYDSAVLAKASIQVSGPVVITWS